MVCVRVAFCPPVRICCSSTSLSSRSVPLRIWPFLRCAWRIVSPSCELKSMSVSTSCFALSTSACVLALISTCVSSSSSSFPTTVFSLDEPLPRTTTVAPLSCCSICCVVPRGPMIRPTKLCVPPGHESCGSTILCWKFWITPFETIAPPILAATCLLTSSALAVISACFSSMFSATSSRRLISSTCSCSGSGGTASSLLVPHRLFLRGLLAPHREARAAGAPPSSAPSSPSSSAVPGESRSFASGAAAPPSPSVENCRRRRPLRAAGAAADASSTAATVEAPSPTSVEMSVDTGCAPSSVLGTHFSDSFPFAARDTLLALIAATSQSAAMLSEPASSTLALGAAGTSDSETPMTSSCTSLCDDSIVDCACSCLCVPSSITARGRRKWQPLVYQ
mmetsp:Transcript_34913/g.74482  ORF Transcript_34913/g.74482 Transcript_34913/m.74482 type:complete len:394 (+) Transcript_34913:1397-2578(+)